MLFKKKDIVGIDIGSKYIKAVQLKAGKNGYQLERIGVADLQPELIVDGSILDATRVVDAITSLLTSSDISAKDVTLSVSGHSSVITKRVSIPQISEEELEDSITFEAEQYIPFDIDDVNLDFQILGPAEEANMMDVLIVAVKQDKINDYVSVISDSGLTPVIVDVDAFALENMHDVNYPPNEEINVALVNIGASMINMNIIKGGISVFTRDSSVGGNLHTEALQKHFTISYDNAEKLKYKGTLEGIAPESVAEVIDSASDEIIAEISRSFDYFRDTTNYEKIDEILISGGVALTKGFAEMMTEKLGISTSVTEPFKNIEIPDIFDLEYIKKIEPLVSVAVGLALRRVGDK
ncbi:MAG: type IV pilus assembly protein PilM [Nitrospira sp.]|nr:type IV pilus assembly protein PilM [bacterium]MBL7049010.1 type IV pilus assembly protein PilM [Nitrospira sp.]